MINILLVEDDKSFGYVLSEYMALKNFNITWKETATDAIDTFIKSMFDLVILDVNLKNASGYDVAIELKKHDSSIPLIFLTARDLKIDQLKGYQLGAEEYITKPIDEEILIAKIEAIISRRNQDAIVAEVFKYKDITLNTNKRELVCSSQTTQLTERECLLMKYLITKPNALVKRQIILQHLWENQDEFSRNSMDVYISRLRKYISGSQVNIRNVHGKGFIIE